MSERKTERRTFYWVWFGLFTAVSMIVNGWHAGIKAPMHFAALRDGETHILWEAWKVGDDQPPGWFTWGAVALGVLMPVALAFGSHALANPKPDISRARHRANVVLTGATVLGSFTLSFLAMQDMAMMLMGWSAWVAAIVPIAVDIAIVSALAGLVAHSPAMTESAVQRRVSEQVERLESSLVAVQTRIEERFEAALDAVQERLQEQFGTDLGAVQNRVEERLQERFEADLDAIQERFEERVSADLDAVQGRFEQRLNTELGGVREQVLSRPTAVSRAATVSNGVSRPVTSVSVVSPLTNSPAALTEAVVAAGGIGTQTPEMIQRVIEAQVENPRLGAQKIAELVTAQLPRNESVSKSTVHRILNAARELDGDLSAVGDADEPQRELQAV